MSLFRGRAQVADRPVLPVTACVACGDTESAQHTIVVAPDMPVTVCVEPAPCRQRAQLRGVYLNPTGGPR